METVTWCPVGLCGCVWCGEQWANQFFVHHVSLFPIACLIRGPALPLVVLGVSLELIFYTLTASGHILSISKLTTINHYL